MGLDNFKQAALVHIFLGGGGALALLVGLIMFVMKLAEVGMMVDTSWGVVVGVAVAGLVLVVIDVVFFFRKVLG